MLRTHQGHPITRDHSALPIRNQPSNSTPKEESIQGQEILLLQQKLCNIVREQNKCLKNQEKGEKELSSLKEVVFNLMDIIQSNQVKIKTQQVENLQQIKKQQETIDFLRVQLKQSDL